MKTPTFYGQVKEGKLILDKRDEFDLWLGTLEDDVRVDIKVGKATRSDKQRKYYWGVIIQILAPELNLDPSEANEWCKQHFNNKVISIKGNEVEIGMSIENETTDRVEEIYREIRMWASSVGIFVAEPNEEFMY